MAITTVNRASGTMLAQRACRGKLNLMSSDSRVAAKGSHSATPQLVNSDLRQMGYRPKPRGIAILLHNSVYFGNYSIEGK